MVVDRRLFTHAAREIGRVSGSLEIRQATLADLDGIIDVHTQARLAYYGAGGLTSESIVNPTLEREQRTGWTAAIGSPRKRVLCAVVDGRIVGIAAMGPPLSSEVDAGTVGQLYQIHVVPGSWRKGIGSTLHALFVRYLEEISLPTGLLEVWERNSRARAFYTRHGWKPDGEAREGPDNSQYIGMRLELMAHRAATSTSPQQEG
ncbi:GNAT family N-acetyltransferase [Micromonospora chersina]|uniref:GNAT family N-acetyltransferase n=1 Tax=Micromonospora chersina TaxID=47854 RepID=UPI001FCBE8CD|nr:GNAT family N-acetyltransferase [Micromonospora chersina]